MENDGQHRPPSADGTLSRDISKANVALYKEYMGRGPTKVRTTVARDTIVCVAQDCLTNAEHKLAERDQADFVREIRKHFQSAMEEDAVAKIEDLSGRRVTAFLSDHDPVADIAIEAFVRAPVDVGEEAGSAALGDGEG
jgi:uncharacterized protein YbcI